MGNNAADVQQTLPTRERLGSALGFINRAHTRLQAASVSHVLEACVKHSQVGRGTLLESTQEKGQKGEGKVFF